jgi:hypothetical protein
MASFQLCSPGGDQCWYILISHTPLSPCLSPCIIRSRLTDQVLEKWIRQLLHCSSSFHLKRRGVFRKVSRSQNVFFFFFFFPFLKLTNAALKTTTLRPPPKCSWPSRLQFRNLNFELQKFSRSQSMMPSRSVNCICYVDSSSLLFAWRVQNGHETGFIPTP